MPRHRVPLEQVLENARGYCRHRLTPAEHLERLDFPATPSDYLRHLPDWAKDHPHAPCILICRESDPSQSDNLEPQVNECMQAVKSMGLELVRTYSFIGNAGSEKAQRVLKKAEAVAKRKNAIIVFESTSRVIRSSAYHPRTNRHARPSDREFEELMRQTDGVPLFTIHHPDTSPNEETGLQTKRGMTPKERRGGRAPKNEPGFMIQKRREDEPAALKILDAGGSLGEASRRTGRPKSTIQYWLKQDRTKNPQHSTPDEANSVVLPKEYRN